MKLFEGRMEDFTGPRKFDAKAIKENYEKHKNERTDKAVQKLIQALADFITVAVEEDQPQAIDSAVCMTVGGDPFSGGYNVRVAGRFLHRDLGCSEGGRSNGEVTAWR